MEGLYHQQFRVDNKYDTRDTTDSKEEVDCGLEGSRWTHGGDTGEFVVWGGKLTDSL